MGWVGRGTRGLGRGGTLCTGTSISLQKIPDYAELARA